jgi:cell wall-associated NlpC family hydrolase
MANEIRFTRAAVAIMAALKQLGDEYRLGAEVSLLDPDPRIWDCSELVQWAYAQAGVTMPDGSWIQYAATRRIAVDDALRTAGALLFIGDAEHRAAGNPEGIHHVGISLGTGRYVIEAKGRAYGVLLTQASRDPAGRWKRWTHAGKLDDLYEAGILKFGG